MNLSRAGSPARTIRANVSEQTMPNQDSVRCCARREKEAEWASDADALERNLGFCPAGSKGRHRDGPVSVRIGFTPAAVACWIAKITAHGSQIVRDTLSTDLGSAGAVKYAVLLPDDYEADGERLPLWLMLHGSGGDREQFARC